MGKAGKALGLKAGEPREDIEYKLCAALTLATRRMHTRFENRLRPEGQTLARWKVLRAISEARSGITLAELSKVLGVTSASLVSVVDDLEARRQVSRVPQPGDRRANLLFIQPEGRLAMAAVDVTAAAFRAEMYAGLEPEDLQAGLRVLEHLALRLGPTSASAP